MTGLKQRFWAYTIMALFVIAITAHAGSLRAQEGAKPASNATTIPSTQEEPKSEKAEGQEKVKEGEEAEAIRHSPSVKWIARHIGLTNDQAYWLVHRPEFCGDLLLYGQAVAQNTSRLLQGTHINHPERH